MSMMPSLLRDVKFRIRRQEDELVETLFYIVGDVDRYLAALDNNKAEEMRQEITNIRFRMKELKTLAEASKKWGLSSSEH
jgi:hypothetical protein